MDFSAVEKDNAADENAGPTKREMLEANDLSQPADSDQKNIFPFFRLPRELRDKIYSELTTCLVIPFTPSLDRSTALWTARKIECTAITDAPLLNSILVSRQFNQELNEEMARPKPGAKLMIMLYHISSLLLGMAPSLKAVLSKVECLELQAPILSYMYHSCLFDLQRLLSMMPSLKTLEWVTVTSLAAPGSVRPMDPNELRQHLSRGLKTTTGDELEILSSIVFEDDLFILRNGRKANRGGRVPGKRVQALEDDPRNRLVLHGQPSTNLDGWFGLNLEVDEQETGVFGDIENCIQGQHARMVKGLKGNLQIWRAGYRTIRTARAGHLAETVRFRVLEAR